MFEVQPHVERARCALLDFRNTASRRRQLMAASVIRGGARKLTFDAKGPVGLSQLAATHGETRSRPMCCRSQNDCCAALAFDYRDAHQRESA